MPLSDLFHGRPYYFLTEADKQKAQKISRYCGNDVAWFEDELDHADIPFRLYTPLTT